MQHLRRESAFVVNTSTSATARSANPASPDHPPPSQGEPCPNSVADLVQRIKLRDQAAYRELYRLYRGRLLAYATQLLRCEHAAEDIVQEVFDRIWRYSSSFDAARTRHPDGWIFQIARNQSMNELARLGRLTELIDGDEADQSAWSCDGDPHADRLLDLAALRAAQEQLPSTYRQVVFLRFELDFSLHEIAEHLSIPLGTAKTWLRRALIALREILCPGSPLPAA